MRFLRSSGHASPTHEGPDRITGGRTAGGCGPAVRSAAQGEELPRPLARFQTVTKRGSAITDSVDRRSQARSGWGWTFVAGILLVLAGIVAIFHPLATGLATGLLLAWSLIAGGAFAFVAGLTDLRARGGWLYVVLGLLAVLTGIVVMFNPFAGALSLVWVIGVWLVVGGIIELFGGLSVRHGRTWLISFGLVDILIGVLLMFMDPFSALFLLAVAVGVSFVLRGLGLALFGLGLRRSFRR